MKYPTRSGLIVPPYELYGEPTEQQLHTRRATTMHHGYFNRASYNDVRWRSIFRNLVTNVYPLVQEDHMDLHNQFSSPIMPKDSLMVDVIDEYAFEHGQVDVVLEKRTHEVRSISLDSWDLIKGGNREQTLTAGGGRFSQPTYLGINSSLSA